MFPVLFLVILQVSLYEKARGMNMLRIATVEDDAHDLEALRTHLNRYEKENGLKFLITEFQDGEDIVTEYSADYDLILMDIEMAFLNGMKAAEKSANWTRTLLLYL